MLHLITVSEQSELKHDCSFGSSFAYFASWGLYHENLFISTVAGVMCLCGGHKKIPSTSSLVQFSIQHVLSGLSGS